MGLLLSFLVSVGPITVSKNVIYCPESASEIGPGGLSGKNLWLCHIRAVDSLARTLITDVTLDLRPFGRTYLLKDGRARFALTPGQYTFIFSKGNYHQKQETVRIIPDQITMVYVEMTKPREILEQERKKARIDSLMVSGITLFNRDSLFAAREVFNRVLTVDSSYQNAQHYLAEIDAKIKGIIAIYVKEAKDLAKRKKYKEAIVIWNKVLSYDTTNQDAKDEIKKLERTLKARTLVNRVTKEDVEGYYKRGVNLFIDGDYQGAYRLFKKVLRYSPNHSGAKRYLKRTEARIKSIKK